MKPRPIKWALMPESEPIFSEEGFLVEIVDEAAGEFVTLSCGDGDAIRINPSEWPELRAALDLAVESCRK